MLQLSGAMIGFGVDSPDAEVAARREEFVAWARAVGAALDCPVVEVPLAKPVPSFDVVKLERVERWLLHNRHVPLVGVIKVAPVPGDAWAVAGEWGDLELPEHLSGWGPPILDADALNAPIGNALDGFGVHAREHADRYKPRTLGNVIFNYWT